MTAKEFATDSTARASTLERFRDLARVYRAHYPDFARVTLFDEAPLGAFDSPSSDSGRSYLRDVKAFRRHAPEAFAYMYKAFKEVTPEAEVGVFLHHPHNASGAMAGRYSFIGEFMEKTSNHGATPDFIYSDVYRGYFNRGFGVEATNAYITDVVAHTREVARQYGVEAYQLGQVHTIKLGYTPGRWEIDTNVKAMLAGKPDGIGWYWPNYASTNHAKGPDGTPAQPEGYDVSFDPFVPNNWGRIGPAGSLYGTSRGRFTYAYLRAVEATRGIDPHEHFDLWIYGRDFDHVEHEVYLKTRDTGEWTFLGAINPQQDRGGYVEQAGSEHRYSYSDRWHAVVFHGLRRDRFLKTERDSAALEVKIETRGESDTSEIGALYAMPYRPTRNYVSEAKATRLIEQQPRWMAINSLAYRRTVQHLIANEPQTVCLHSRAYYVRPRPAVVSSDRPFIDHIEAPVRHKKPGVLEVEWLELLFTSQE